MSLSQSQLQSQSQSLAHSIQACINNESKKSGNHRHRELQSECRKLGIPAVGSVPVLIERLQVELENIAVTNSDSNTICNSTSSATKRSNYCNNNSSVSSDTDTDFSTGTCSFDNHNTGNAERPQKKQRHLEQSSTPGTSTRTRGTCDNKQQKEKCATQKKRKNHRRRATDTSIITATTGTTTGNNNRRSSSSTSTEISKTMSTDNTSYNISTTKEDDNDTPSSINNTNMNMNGNAEQPQHSQNHNNNYSNSTTTNDIDTRTSIAPSILSCIGNTPLIRLNQIPNNFNVPCEILAKCEFFNAGGSVKDRIALQMIIDAEKQGIIKPGDTLIEPTSGNTGIGIALASAVKGYKCIIVLPEKMSKEKVDVLKALNAQIIRTPTEAAYDAPDSHISVAKRLQTEMPNSYILDQYKNPGNPNAHYYGTAEEIWTQCQHKIDMLVAGAGTGGTITGIARKLKEYNPNIIIVGVDPVGSILAQPSSLNDYKRLEPYAVEGIGYDFIPNVLDRSLVDKWYKSNDTDSLVMMRRLIRDEGLLCGGSCGAAMSIAVQAAKDYKLTKDQRCVVILPDSVRNYMTKALSDDWMLDHSFIDNDVIRPKKIQTWWADHFVRDIPLATPLTITSNVTCKAAIALLKKEGFDMVPVIGESGSVIGVVTEGNISSQILSGRIESDNVTVEEAKVIYKTFRKIGLNDKLADLAHALDLEPFALVVTEQRCYNDENKIQTKIVVSGIVTRIDLLDYISKGSDDQQTS